MRGSDVNWEGAAYLGVTEQPDLRGPRYDQRENTGRAERRIFCAAVTSTDYPLLSSSVRRYGYWAPQWHASVLGDPGREGPPSTRYRHPYSPSTTYLIAACADVCNGQDGPELGDRSVRPQ